MTTAATIASLRAAFGKLDKMDPNGPVYARLCSILDRADDEAIVAARDSGIKFVSSLALNRCIRRGLPAAAR